MGCRRPNPGGHRLLPRTMNLPAGKSERSAMRNNYHHQILSSIPIFQLFHCLHLTGSFNMCVPGVFSFTFPFPPENVTNLHPTFCSENLQVHLCSTTRQSLLLQSWIYIGLFSGARLKFNPMPNRVHQLPLMQYWYWAWEVVGSSGVWFWHQDGSCCGKFSSVSGRNPPLYPKEWNQAQPLLLRH